jgi:hypothetical protein
VKIVFRFDGSEALRAKVDAMGVRCALKPMT